LWEATIRLGGCLRILPFKNATSPKTLAGAEMTNDAGGKPDAYTASLLGRIVECVSLQDATSVRIAEAILSDAGGRDRLAFSDASDSRRLFP